jgi:hypothetical protein
LNTLALETDFAVLTAGRGDEGVTVAVRERPDVINRRWGIGDPSQALPGRGAAGDRSLSRRK